MRVLHAYNQHRGGGGANNATQATIDVSRHNGLDVKVFTRSSAELSRGLLGRLRAGAGAIYSPGSVRQFDALLDSFKPDVVHIHEIFPLVSPGILPRCARRGVPVVMTCVDYRLTCPVVTHLCDGQVCTRCVGGHEYWAVLRNCRGNLPESLAMALYSILARKLRLFSDYVDHFVAPSEFTRNWLIEHADIGADRVTTISPIVDAPENGTDPGVGGYVAFAGRFAREKGLDTLFEASRLCGLPFQVCRNENSLVTVQIPPEVGVVVTRGREDLDAFYCGARMLVVPSVWFETFGLVGGEAMSRGIPVVASRIGAISCLVEEGVDGLLFEPRDPRDLAEKVTRLWKDPDLCRQLGQAGRRKAATLWNADRHFELHMAVYQGLRRGHIAAPGRPMRGAR